MENSEPSVSTPYDELAAHPNMGQQGLAGVVGWNDSCRCTPTMHTFVSVASSTTPMNMRACDTTAMLMRTTYALLPNPHDSGLGHRHPHRSLGPYGQHGLGVPVPRAAGKVLVQHFGKNTARFRVGAARRKWKHWVDAPTKVEGRRMSDVTYWSCDEDDEHLVHETWGEAVGDYLDRGRHRLG